jgi:hypothetical protein
MLTMPLQPRENDKCGDPHFQFPLLLLNVFGKLPAVTLRAFEIRVTHACPPACYWKPEVALEGERGRTLRLPGVHGTPGTSARRG